MIPLYDNVPRVHPPLMVITIIAVNVIIFLYQLAQGPGGTEFAFLYGSVPLRLLDPAWAEAHGFPGGGVLTLLSYMFLHADWLHLVLNMWMLWIFADNIEDVTGHGAFAVFYLLCGILAGLLHIIFNPGSFVPIIGASGAVAGVMGAYFVLYPHGRVATLIFIFVVRLPATVFLGIWFGVQLFSGLGESAGSAAGIAWWAHVGGFASGMMLIRLFVRKDRCYYCYNPDRKHYDLSD